MGDFRFRVGFRVVLIGCTMALFIFMVSRPNMVFAAVLMGFIILGQLFELYYFSSQTNRKLTRFLESVKYSDFISGFTADNKLGKTFRQLNTEFNEVLEAFRKARSEKEENWQYLNTVVQQVRTGILSFDDSGRVQLMNTNAKRFLNSTALQSIHDLKPLNPVLYQAILDARPGKSTLHKTNRDILLTIQATEMRVRGQNIKLVTLQNIQSELQKQELEAWQNLTRVLRHEIMNSITPISSLTSTLKDVLDHDLKRTNGHYELPRESADDLREGLTTIEGRSRGLIRFIDAYREYTSLPQPVVRSVRVKDLLDKVAQFMKPDFRDSGIVFQHVCQSDYLTIQADEEMIEQVLINLIKNAREALAGQPNGRIDVRGSYDELATYIEVIDNGPGIIAEALEKIFIPFFTTKKGGSGIGLALSRQIMQMHNGTLTAESEPHTRTVFRLRF
ncbi:MAG: sensor histidine kinase [Cyclobacteriaceae bacterium]|jgi:two-component system nitrogen regulation sensor histidine kinase NtrY